MKDTRLIATYRGKKIDTLSRDELIEALNELINEYQSMMKRHIEDLEVFEQWDRDNSRKE